MSATGTRKRSAKGSIPNHNDIKESATRQLNEVKNVATDAVTSNAWAYPLLGVLYLVRHPSLMQPLLPTIFKGALISLGVLAAMFFLTYLPQVAVLAFVSGPLAFIAAVPLVLGETYVVLNIFLRSFLVGQIGVDLFDAVLLQKNQSALVERGRQVSAGSSGKGKVLGGMLTKPLSKFSTDNIVRYVLSLPLNLIPVVGTVFFLGYNGFKSGPGYHARYFQLKGYDKEKRHSAIEKRRGAYTAFGFVAMILNLIPVVSNFFIFTTTVGAALWAADLENKSPSGASLTSTHLTNGEDETEVEMPSLAGAAQAAKKDL